MLAAAVLGSGVAFLDSTVVTVALPTIAEDLGASFSQLQWISNAYLLTLGSLVLVGGAMGDRFGRRRLFVAGLALFTLASLACGLAPSAEFLIAARAVQGVGAAMLTPVSLGMLQAVYRNEDTGRAVGLWSGLSGVSTAAGPFLGGWLVDAATWRLVFVINVPIAGAAIAIAVRHIPETRDPGAQGRPVDVLGGALVTFALAALVWPLIEQDAANGVRVASLLASAVAFVAFVLTERRVEYPMLPLGLFRSRPFTVLNLYTLALYGALSATLFLLTVHLQVNLGYSALLAGVSSLPITVLLLMMSPRAGARSGRSGPWPLLVWGASIAGLGLLLLTRVEPGVSYLTAVFPGVLVFGVGLGLLVAPLTSSALAVVGADRAGIASGVNNAVARVAGLLAVAGVPLVAGISVLGSDGSAATGPGSLADGFAAAMVVCALLCLVSAVVAALALPRGVLTPVLAAGADGGEDS